MPRARSSPSADPELNSQTDGILTHCASSPPSLVVVNRGEQAAQSPDRNVGIVLFLQTF